MAEKKEAPKNAPGVDDLCCKLTASGTGAAKVEAIRCCANSCHPDKEKFLSEVAELLGGNTVTLAKVVEIVNATPVVEEKKHGK